MARSSYAHERCAWSAAVHVLQETGAVRVKDEEVVVPIIVGTVAFNMGRKVRA